MTMLSASLQELTAAFVQSLVGAIRNMPISEINGDGSHETHSHTPRAHTAPARARAPRAAAPASAKTPKTKASKSGRLARRTPEQIEEAIASVVALVRKHPDGLRAEDIRTELGLDVREVPRILKQGIAEGQLKILSGQKRSTAYGVKGGGKVKTTKKPAARATAAKKSPKKAAAKAPKKAGKQASAKKAALKKKTKKAHAPHAAKAALNGTHAAAPAAG
jgi:hypothetical protein